MPVFDLYIMADWSGGARRRDGSPFETGWTTNAKWLPPHVLDLSVRDPLDESWLVGWRSLREPSRGKRSEKQIRQQLSHNFSGAQAFLISPFREVGCLAGVRGMWNRRLRISANSAVLASLALMLVACAWQAARPDHAHVLSDMADQAASDSAKCQASGATLGSLAYKQCRALLEGKLSIEKDLPVVRGHPGN